MPQKKVTKSEYLQMRDFGPKDDLCLCEEVNIYEFFSIIGKRAATNAINENKAMELPVTYLKEGWVVREMPGGEVERIVEIQSSPGKWRKGTVIDIRKGH
ncbi:hypothetical protein [Chitinophaga sp. HK235]|uniref:hypothetical protein n=1 Tax=Chitinophaga sp. HK235 TaxID=2952571 RepID=UPI001BA655F9|nr:hypothetical protein [Chitinophaga sp. HK235]